GGHRADDVGAIDGAAGGGHDPAAVDGAHVRARHAEMNAVDGEPRGQLRLRDGPADRGGGGVQVRHGAAADAFTVGGAEPEDVEAIAGDPGHQRDDARGADVEADHVQAVSRAGHDGRSSASSRDFMSSSSASKSVLPPAISGRACEQRKELCVHQSMPISRALSTDEINRRILIVNSSTSTRRMRMSPAITTPRSSTRSSTSARLAPSVEWTIWGITASYASSRLPTGPRSR